MISIFISSTFMDMQVERDLLQKEVLPELRDYARQYGEEVQFIDLRWGVDLSKVDEEKATEKILEVCFKNIEDSEPYFLGLLGERYGTLIEKDKVPSSDLKRYMGKSITEAEIEFGVFTDRSNKNFFLFREPFKEESVPTANRKIYLEAVQRDRIVKLKKKIRNTVPKERILNYWGRWENDELKLEDFVKNVTTVLKDLIYEDLKVEAVLSDQEREINTMHFYIKQKARQFEARTSDLERIKDLLQDKTLVLIRGEAGSGKSTLLSALSEELKKKGKVIPIISDLTSRSRTAENILIQQIWALEKILGKESFTEVDKEITTEQLHVTLSFLISQLPKEKPLYFLIDALDQLESDDLRDSLNFLPRFLREGDRIVITYLDDLKVTGKNRYGKTGLTEYELKTLNKEDSKEVLNSARAYREIPNEVVEEILRKKHSNNPLYLSLLINRLFLLDAPHFREIASHNQDNKDHTAEYLRKLIAESPERLEDLSVVLMEEAGEYFGKNLSEKVFKTLSFSRRGFTVSALEQIIGKDFKLLDFELLSKYLDNLLVRQEDGRIDFSHRIVRKGLRDYFKGQEDDNYKEVFTFLKGLDDLDPLKLREFLFYCIKTGDIDEIKSYLDHILKNENEEIKTKLAEEIKNLILEENIEWLLEVINTLTPNDLPFIEFLNYYLPDKFIWSLNNLKTLDKLYEYICKKIKTLIKNDKENIELKSILVDSISELASIEKNLGEKKKAERNNYYAFKLQNEVFKVLGTPIAKSDLAHTLNNLGLIYSDLGSFKLAEKFSQRALELREELVEILGTPNSQSNLALTFNNLGIIQRNLGNNKGAKESYKRAIELQEVLIETVGTLKTKSGLVSSLNNLGIVQKDLGNINEAKESYKRATEIGEELVEIVGTPETKSDLGRTLNNLGTVQKDLGNYKEAEKSYQRAIELQEELVETLETPVTKLDLAGSFNNLGDLQSSISDNTIAEISYQRAIELEKEIVEIVGTIESKLDLASSLNNLGTVQRDLGNNEGAKESYQRAIELREELVKIIDSPETKLDLAGSFNNLGILQYKLGDNKGAEENYQRAIALHVELVEILGISKAKLDLANLLNNLGIVLKNSGNYKGAEESYQRAVELQEELVNSVGTPETKSDLAGSLNNLGTLQRDLGNNKGAEENFKRALAFQEELVETLGTPETQLKLAGSYNSLGTIQRNLGNNEEAEESYQRAIELQEGLVETVRTPEVKLDLAGFINNIGLLQRSLGKHKEAEESYLRAIELQEGLVETLGTPKTKLNLANSLNNLGILQNELEDNKGAKKSYLRAIELQEELVENLGTPEIKSELVKPLYNLGILQCDLGELEEAQENIKKTVELEEDLIETLGTNKAKSSLVKSLNILGRIQDSLEDYKTAERNYKRALELREELVEDLGTLESKLDLASSLYNLSELQSKLGDNESAEKNKMRAKILVKTVLKI